MAWNVGNDTSWPSARTRGRAHGDLAATQDDVAADGPRSRGVALGPAPQPNGCAPPVYSGGQYVGQDPDPYIRSQLLRDPATGYTNNF